MENKSNPLKVTTGCIKTILLCGVVLVALLSGCGLTQVQKDGVASFARASSTLGSASSEQFVSFRNDVIRMQTTRLAIEGKKLPSTRPDGKRTDRQFYTEELNLDSGLDPDNLEKRLKAVDLLAAYGNLLQTLAEKSQEKELSEASESFAGSLKRFPGSPLPPETTDGIGKILTSAGSLWIEKEKKREIQELVPQMSPLIQSICDGLENDFNIKGKGFVVNVDLVQDRLAREAIDGLKRETSGIGDRRILIEGLAWANDSKENLERVTGKMLKAISSLRQADKELVMLVTERQISLETIKSYSKDVNDLVKAIKPFTQK